MRQNWLIEADFGVNMALQTHVCYRLGPLLALVNGSNVTFGIPAHCLTDFKEYNLKLEYF